MVTARAALDGHDAHVGIAHLQTNTEFTDRCIPYIEHIVLNRAAKLLANCAMHENILLSRIYTTTY